MVTRFALLRRAFLILAVTCSFTVSRPAQAGWAHPVMMAVDTILGFTCMKWKMKKFCIPFAALWLGLEGWSYQMESADGSSFELQQARMDLSSLAEVYGHRQVAEAARLAYEGASREQIADALTGY